ncbi:MAG: nucleotidyl transferase AbiEii/AbiGii toxin family protein [Actinomycetota bacterium]
MILSREGLARAVASSGFREDYLEKSIRLLYLLEAIKDNPFLRSRLVLKGGTALNLFIMELPRLSVDIDLNYIGSPERGVMLEERPLVERTLQAICGREGFRVRRIPSDHAGGKWLLRFDSTLGRGGSLELDINFLMRIPLWDPNTIDSQALGDHQVGGIAVLDKHELMAGKAVALLSRRAARDLFDCHGLPRALSLVADKLRLAFVVNGGMSRRDWRDVSLDDIGYDINELHNVLLPTLRNDYASGIKDVSSWADRLVLECREELSVLLPLRANEVDFLTSLNEEGEILPGLLTSDKYLARKIERQPGLLWKAQNVKEYRRT